MVIPFDSVVADGSGSLKPPATGISFPCGTQVTLRGVMRTADGVARSFAEGEALRVTFKVHPDDEAPALAREATPIDEVVGGYEVYIVKDDRTLLPVGDYTVDAILELASGEAEEVRAPAHVGVTRTIGLPGDEVSVPSSSPLLGRGPQGLPRILESVTVAQPEEDALNFGADFSITRTPGVRNTVDLADTAVAAGSYTNTSLTVDGKGRITAASSGQVRPVVYSVLPTLPDAAFPAGTIIRDPFDRLYVNRQGDWSMVDNDNVVHALDVRFGAKGDGVTDDGPALNAAGLYALSTGRWLLLDRCVGYYCATPLTFTVDQTTQPNAQGGASEFAIIGYGQSSPLIIATGIGTDFITHTATSVEWHQFRMQDVFGTTPDISVTDPCADRFVNSIETHGDPLVGTAIYRNVRLGAAHFAVETFRFNGGAFLVDDVSFQGCSSPRHFHADQAVSVVINNPRCEYEFKWDGVYTAEGTCSSLVYVTPHGQTTSRSDVVVRGAVLDLRTHLLLDMANTANFAGNIEISDFTANCSDGLLTLINCRRVNIFDGEYTPTGTQLLAATLNPGSITIKNVRAPGHGITTNDDGPAVVINIEDSDITDATHAPGLGVYGYTGGTKVVVYRSDAGIKSRGCLAGGSIAVGQLVKPSGTSFVALTTSDDASVATGVCLDAVSSGQWFRCVELRGSVVTAATDGASITSGATVYASTGTAGVISATVAGGRAGIALEASDDTANTCKILWAPSAAPSGGGSISPPTWLAVSFNGTYANLDSTPGGPQTCQYNKDALNKVNLRGAYTGSGSTIITLPAGYRPPRWIVVTATKDGAFCRYQILPDGTVNHLDGSSASYGFLDNISFSVDA